MRHANGCHHNDDEELGDISEEITPWWLPKLEKANGRPKNDVPPSPRREFKLPPHHVLVTNGYGTLYPGDPANRIGLPVLTSPDGFPVARLHSDLKPGEVSWVIR